MKHIGQKIRTIREQKGIGLNALAARLNVSPAYLSNLETGKTQTVQFSFLKKLQEELNFTSMDLFTDENSEDQAEFSEFVYRLKRANELLKQLNSNDPKVADYLLSVMEQGLELHSDIQNSSEEQFKDCDYH